MHPKCNFETWHVQKLITLYKGKGDAKDLNNWREMCLKETTAKIVSSIITDRLLIQLKKINANTQFSHMGYQEALHSVRTALTICCHHGLETYAFFVDLVKAFNSINHDMLYKKNLAIDCPPEKLINTVKKMCNECSVNIPIGKKNVKVSFMT